MEIVSPSPQTLAPSPSSPSSRSQKLPAARPSSWRVSLAVRRRPLARNVAALVRARGLIPDPARHDLARRDLAQPVAVRGVPPAVRRHAVEREIGKRHEALRLLVGGRGMRIASRQPTPRAIVLVRLAAVDHDLRHAPLQLLRHPPPPPPLRVATG